MPARTCVLLLASLLAASASAQAAGDEPPPPPPPHQSPGERAEAHLDAVAAALSRHEVHRLDQLRARMSADMAVITWVDVGSEHWGSVLRKEGGPAWVKLPGTGPANAWTAADDRLPERLRARLDDTDADTAKHVRLLRAQRLAPLAPHLAGVRRLVVLSSGAMAGVPLEVLTDAYTISYASPTTQFARPRQGPRPAGPPPTLLAVGDPAPQPPRQAADREVKAIASLFTQADVLVGPDASAGRLEQLRADGRLTAYRYLHFATPCEVDPRVGFATALLLAPEAGKGSRQARLTASTVLSDWRLDADLVTLSAGGSGLARLGGAGLPLGFSMAFLTAGARSVVVSLWDIDDDATALLMQRFYQNLLGKRDGLKAPLPKAEALREARRWLADLTGEQAAALLKALPGGRARPGALPAGPRPYAHPYYWAAFILIGDPD